MSSSPRTRCPIHGTVLSPEGNCVLCRSRAPTRHVQRISLLVLILGLGIAAIIVFMNVKARFAQHSADSSGDNATPNIDTTSRTLPSAANAESLATASVPGSNATQRDSAPRAARLVEHASFAERDPRGFRPELRARGERELSGDYQTKGESYELIVPASAANDEPIGLLIWISATPSGALPNPDWAKLLDTHRLAWIGPNRAGNDREIAIRLGLALDSVLAARRRMNLDPNRLFIGGISGGAKTAFRAQLYYPEIFRGAVLAAGIEYIRDVPIASKPGSFWPQRIGTPTDLNDAKQRPIAITTGPKDFNYAQIHDVVAALGQDRFSHVTVFDWPELGHEPPPAELLDRALSWVEQSGR